ncbi:MAG TPA: cobalamin-binding protein [Gemmatimonadaceae bacterium]|nr:cobalamin-binding protein [Gemmatimonadaceae bacterium]
MARAACIALAAGALACSRDARIPARDSTGAAIAAAHPSDALNSGAISIVDDGGFTVTLPHPAQRVISLVPSAMETLIALGATKQVVGRTRYDRAPEAAAIPSVGGGLDPSVEAMVSLRPDLVISWESDKRQEVRQKLTSLGIPVFILRTQDTTDIFHGIASIGRLTGHDSAANAIATAVRETLDSVRRDVAGRTVPTVFYVVDNDPPMTAGRHTFLAELISLAGAHSIFDDLDQLWPSIAMEEIVRRDPDILVVPVGEFKGNSLERFRTLPGWRNLRAVRTGRVVTVSADLVSRPGPSIAQTARVLERVFHPELAQGSLP